MEHHQLSATFLLLLAVTLSIIAVDGRLADTSIVAGPDCAERSVDAEYNEKAARLVDIFVDETKNVARDDEVSEYRYYHSFPNKDVGSVAGGAVCDSHLWKLDCWACLVTAKNKINSDCERTLDARVKLGDCELWYNMIR